MLNANPAIYCPFKNSSLPLSQVNAAGAEAGRGDPRLDERVDPRGHRGGEAAAGAQGDGRRNLVPARRAARQEEAEWRHPIRPQMNLKRNQNGFGRRGPLHCDPKYGVMSRRGETTQIWSDVIIVPGS